MKTEIRVRVERSLAGGEGRILLRSLDGDELIVFKVDEDRDLLLANLPSASGVWHPVEIEHPNDPLRALLRFRDYPGEVVWHFAGGAGQGPRAWRSGPAPGKRAEVPFLPPDLFFPIKPPRGQVWERTDWYMAPEPEEPTVAEMIATAEWESTDSMSEAPGSPTFDGRLRLLAAYFKWSTDDVSRWVGKLLGDKAEHVRFTGARTPAEYEDRLDALRRDAEAEARSRIRSAPPEAPEAHS